ncbi:MAG: tRNA (adenosine(37)-N6)-threonylcarbamoyltransferase complex transferase subunit TsaD [Candidatus Paceibacterota bacterium]
MKILAIETSCDETAVSILKAEGDISDPRFSSLADVTLSQTEIHSQYGGVFPSLAKREHAKNIVPLLEKTLKEVEVTSQDKTGSQLNISKNELTELFTHEDGLAENIYNFLKKTPIPEIDAIAVTYGPGLEPALWVGINTAKALSKAWNKPVLAVNHLEGHIASTLFNKAQNKENSPLPELPALALIISGGHTELINIKKWGEYQFLGGTVDDAVGEAFDKVARMLDLPYPGGPPLSKLAAKSRKDNKENPFVFPRPMKHSDDLNFSFSGLKTAVLYKIKEKGNITEEEKAFIARAFEDAVADVLGSKMKKAIEASNSRSVLVCGGVSANKYLRESFKEVEQETGKKLFIPDAYLSTDNACMIAVAGFVVQQTRKEDVLDVKEAKHLKAKGVIKLGDHN